jgi:hypothetical protein
MSTFPTSSRPSAPQIAPVEHQGVRYEQDRHDDSAGDQPGGYLVAIDSKTGDRLWRLKVYNIARSGPPGTPALALYFRSMKLSAEGSALDIENEAGGIYRVDLKTQSSTQVSGPAETAAPKPSTKPKPTP